MANAGRNNRDKKIVQVPDFLAKKLFHRLIILEAEGLIRHFTLQALSTATNDFSPDLINGEGGHSKVYQSKLEDGQSAAVKVLKRTHSSAEDLLQEVETLSCTKHQNAAQIVGHCDTEKMPAIVYNLLKGSLTQYLRHIKRRDRMGVAIGVARALE